MSMAKHFEPIAGAPGSSPVSLSMCFEHAPVSVNPQSYVATTPVAPAAGGGRVTACMRGAPFEKDILDSDALLPSGHA